jgi:3-hydroxyisobutyrate dehydrogenase
MKTVALVGTGIMGSGMTANFLKSGYQVMVWNRTASHADSLVKQGAELAATPRAAAEQADIIFEVTADDASSQAVWKGKDGILAGASADKVLIASATLSIDWTEELTGLCQDKGLTFFDMPLTGGRPAAESGNLTLLVGGNETQLEALKPDLQAISSKIFYFGPTGSGMKYKLILNSLQAAHIVAVGEAIALAQAAGLDLKTVSGALADRPGGIATKIGLDSYHHQPQPITFSVDWITKDLGYAKRLAGELKLPILGEVLSEYKHSQQAGHGNDDWTVVNEDK